MQVNEACLFNRLQCTAQAMPSILQSRLGLMHILWGRTVWHGKLFLFAYFARVLVFGLTLIASRCVLAGKPWHSIALHTS